VVPAGGSFHREGDGGREIGERLPDPGSAFQQQRPAICEQAHEVASHPDLRLAHAVTGEVAGPARLVGERRGDRVLVERHGRLVARGDRDELRRRRLRRAERRARHQREPGGFRREALQRAACHRVATLAATRARCHVRHHARGVERVRERAVALLAAEQHAGEGLEAQVRRVGMRDREEILRVEVALATQLRSDETAEEALLELGVVRHDHAPFERGRDRLGELVDARRRGDVRVAEPRQTLDGARQWSLRPQQALERREPGLARVDQHRAELEDLGVRILREAGGLQVDEGERTQRRSESGQRVGIDPDLARKRMLDGERRQDARRRFRPCTRDPGA